jgi:prepilin-type N-terminal cleavage/methylation domain-containing protein/prepilin-type processing-associated H-X9-DG protein
MIGGRRAVLRQTRPHADAVLIFVRNGHRFSADAPAVPKNRSARISPLVGLQFCHCSRQAGQGPARRGPNDRPELGDRAGVPSRDQPRPLGPVVRARSGPAAQSGFVRRETHARGTAPPLGMSAGGPCTSGLLVYYFDTPAADMRRNDTPLSPLPPAGHGLGRGFSPDGLIRGDEGPILLWGFWAKSCACKTNRLRWRSLAMLARTRRGFSLTELLIVICILLILMSILVVGGNLAYSHALQVKCQNRMEQIWTACLTYATGNGGKLPTAWSHELSKPWYEQLVDGKYVDNQEAIGCPSSTIEVVRGEGGYTPGTSDEAYDMIELCLNWINDPSNQTGHSTSGGLLWKGGCSKNNPARPAGPAFAALAFLGSGYTTTHPTYGQSLEKALRFLTWCSDHYDGDLADYDNEGHKYRQSYNQGICVMALCDAYRMMGDISIGGRSLKTAAQKAIDYLIGTQDPVYPGFPYTSHHGDNSANAWAWQGVAAAEAAGLLDTALAHNGISRTTWEHRVSEYHWRCIESDGSGVYQAPNMKPGSGSIKSEHRMTPATLGVRLLTGLDREDPSINLQLTYMQNHNYLKYAHATSDSNFDLYITYYTSLALFQIGGDEWNNWLDIFIEPMRNRGTMVGEDQMYYRADEGGDHYPAVYAKYGGHIYPTTIAVLSLQMAAANLLPGSKWYTAGSHSFGYNEFLGQDLRTPSADTIILMDYVQSAITVYDPITNVQARHGGKANILFGDGRVVPTAVDEIEDTVTEKIRTSLLTPEPND